MWTTEGWLSLAVLLDLSSRLVIGWAMGHRLTVELAEQARTMALANQNPVESPVGPGREHPHLPVHGGASNPGVGRGPHRHVDHSGLALPGRDP